MQTSDPIRDLALLVGRLGLGVILIAHGWQKLTSGVGGVAAMFEQSGVPASRLSAMIAMVIELAGGAALILGLAVPVVGVLIALLMAGAFAFVHAGNGLFVSEGGFELVLILGVTGLLLAALGSGRFGLDRVLAPYIPGRAGRESAPSRTS